MYKKVLIISDNVYLSTLVKDLFLKYRSESLSIRFSVSPFSDQSIFSKQLNEIVEVYDLRDHKTVQLLTTIYDLIISIHCKQIFPPYLINNIKCINVHPGYNPINRGWYPQVFAIDQDIQVGATIHEIDEKLDHGNIIDREFIEKEITDTSETLYNKIIQKEIELLNKNLDNILKNNYSIIIPENEGNLYLKKDFKALCELKLDEKLTTMQFVNRIRALTHGEFKNAFFIDPVSKKKVFITIQLTPEN